MKKGDLDQTRMHHGYAVTGKVAGLKCGGQVTKSSGHGEAGVSKVEPSFQKYGSGFRKVKS